MRQLRAVRAVGDRLVTYNGAVNDDLVFKALADPSRRRLLDLLYQRDGRTLTELDSELDMTRFGVMKHLNVLEEAGLITTHRRGREKLHFLNVVPLQQIIRRWLDKYSAARADALIDLKNNLERR
jgi:DNA-binding transcriptional ArsR family regulator